MLILLKKYVFKFISKLLCQSVTFFMFTQYLSYFLIDLFCVKLMQKFK